MATASFEQIDGVLFVSGSLDRSADQEFQTALEKYAGVVKPHDRVVDMSNVRWLTPTGAKVLIQAGQDAQDKGGKLRVLASRHVNQTLSLLGAKTWLAIESCVAPTAKPGAAPANGDSVDASAAPSAAAPAAAAPNPAGDSQKRIVLSNSPAAEATAPEAPPAPSIGGPAPVAPPAPAASGSNSMMQAVTRGGALASPAEELSGGAHLLRILCANRRYSFHFAGGAELIGIVRERIGGSWIAIDTQGTRKMINLDVLEYCEIL
jgi:anti-anti-sigma factor